MEVDSKILNELNAQHRAKVQQHIEMEKLQVNLTKEIKQSKEQADKCFNQLADTNENAFEALAKNIQNELILKKMEDAIKKNTLNMEKLFLEMKKFGVEKAEPSSINQKFNQIKDKKKDALLKVKEIKENLEKTKAKLALIEDEKRLELRNSENKIAHLVELLKHTESREAKLNDKRKKKEECMFIEEHEITTLIEETQKIEQMKVNNISSINAFLNSKIEELSIINREFVNAASVKIGIIESKRQQRDRLSSEIEDWNEKLDKECMAYQQKTIDMAQAIAKITAEFGLTDSKVELGNEITRLKKELRSLAHIDPSISLNLEYMSINDQIEKARTEYDAKIFELYNGANENAAEVTSKKESVKKLNDSIQILEEKMKAIEKCKKLNERLDATKRLRDICDYKSLTSLISEQIKENATIMKLDDNVRENIFKFRSDPVALNAIKFDEAKSLVNIRKFISELNSKKDVVLQQMHKLECVNNAIRDVKGKKENYQRQYEKELKIKEELEKTMKTEIERLKNEIKRLEEDLGIANSKCIEICNLHSAFKEKLSEFEELRNEKRLLEDKLPVIKKKKENYINEKESREKTTLANLATLFNEIEGKEDELRNIPFAKNEKEIEEIKMKIEKEYIRINESLPNNSNSNE